MRENDVLRGLCQLLERTRRWAVTLDTLIFRIPLSLITTWRSGPGFKNAPEPDLMGRITLNLLDLLSIEHDLFPELDEGVPAKMTRAIQQMAATNLLEET